MVKIALANTSSAFRKINLSEVPEKLEKPPYILLNAHIHLEPIAVPLVPCKSLRNAAEVWDLPQRDLERL